MFFYVYIISTLLVDGHVYKKLSREASQPVRTKIQEQSIKVFVFQILTLSGQKRNLLWFQV